MINEIAHRPWPLPPEKWIMHQTWRNLLFIHWPIPVEQLRPFIPSSLKIDTLDGNAWIGIVIFTVDGIYPRRLSSVSLTPQFPEINVRTYVYYDNKPGVYFMSLDVNHWASLSIAKRWYRLPYHSSDISIHKISETFYFVSKRKENTKTPIVCKGSYTPLPGEFRPQEGTLDHWLTERYCLYSRDNRDRLYCGEIHHRPWPLQNVQTEIHENSLFSPFQLNLSGTKPIFHYSKGIDAIIWNVKKTKI